jgi:hypothetical protein
MHSYKHGCILLLTKNIDISIIYIAVARVGIVEGKTEVCLLSRAEKRIGLVDRILILKRNYFLYFAF